MATATVTDKLHEMTFSEKSLRKLSRLLEGELPGEKSYEYCTMLATVILTSVGGYIKTKVFNLRWGRYHGDDYRTVGRGVWVDVPNL